MCKHLAIKTEYRERGSEAPRFFDIGTSQRLMVIP